MTATLVTPSAVIASAPLVRANRVEKRDVQVSVYAAGKIQNAQQETIQSEIPVVLKEIHVKDGDQVEKGDTLFTVDTAATVQELSALAGANNTNNNQVIYQGHNFELPETITSTQDGTVTAIQAQTGVLTDSGSALAIIVADGSLQVAANINETDIASIQLGQKVIITGSGFVGTYEGTITEIASSASQVLNGSVYETVVKTIISIDQPTEELKSGYTAKLQILTDSREDVLLMPYEALCSDENGKYVYLADGTRSKRVDIVTGEEYEEGIEVLEGLQEGDQVIVDIMQIKKTDQRIRLESEGKTS